MLHPARVIPFKTLVLELDRAIAAGLVHRTDDPDTGLSVYTYSKRTVYNQAWTPITRLARGLVIDHRVDAVVATPFVKFHNYGEPGAPDPEGAFTLAEKLDGSMMSLFRWNGQGHISGRNRMTHHASIAAREHFGSRPWEPLDPGVTLIAEYLDPNNRIVVRYPEPALVVLAGYDRDGAEIDPNILARIADAMALPIARTYPVANLREAIALAERLDGDAEGYVLRFGDGTRLKLKGREYRRIHALIADCRPTAIWELLRDGADPETMRRDLPEELWSDFDTILGLIETQIAQTLRAAEAASATVGHLSDAELSAGTAGVAKELMPLVYDLRRYGEIRSKTKAGLIRRIRPVKDVLPGYTPSWHANRIRIEIDG
jgi:RNA ligase